MTTQELTIKYGATYNPPTMTTTVMPANGLQSMASKYGATYTPAPSVQTKPSVFASTKESISHLVSDPLSLKEKISDAIPEAWNTIKDSVMQEKENISSFFKSKTAPEYIGSGLKTIAGGAGIVFSPLTAFFKAAENIPVLGTVSKIVGIAFGAVGEGGAAVGGGVIDALPISQSAKDAIKPGMEEISALAAQLALGRVLSKGKLDKLSQKYGQEDTQTILTEARKLAADESFKIKAIEPTQTIASKVETQLATPKIEEVKPIINLTPKKVMAPREKPVISEPIKLTDNFDLTKPDSPETLKAQHESEVLAELEVSAPGGRAKVNGEQVSWKSTMPGFIPDELRNNALVRTVLDHIKNKTLPTKADEVRLYNVIADEMSAWDKYVPKIDRELNVNEIDFNSPLDKAKLINEQNNIKQLYGKAIETVPADKIAQDQPVAQKIQKLEGTGELKTSGLAETLKRDTIAKGVEADFGELPQYRVRPVKTQEALDFVRKNPELADKIIAGEVAPPEGLLTGEIYSAMKTEAIGLGDTQVLIKLSKAKANDIATMFGREIKAFDANMEIDPVRAIRELNRIKTDKAVKPKKDIINQAKQEIKKSVSKRETWNEFIKSLECK